MKKLTCKYCGRPVSSRDRRLCDECHEYAHEAQLLKKCNFSGSLKEQLDQLYEKVYEMYIVEEVSTTEIWKRLGLSYKTVKRILQNRGERVRTLSESLTLAVANGRVSSDQLGGKQYVRGKHKSWTGDEYWLRSSYEFRYALDLDSKKIQYKVEPFRVKYFDTKLKRIRVAIPDFYLPETNELVEIKSTWTYNEQNMKDKFKAYREAGYKPRLILEGVEKEI